MLFILQYTTSAAHSLSSFRKDSVALLLQPMLLEVVAPQVLSQVVCRLSPTSLHQQVASMVTPIIADALITVTTPHRKHMASHTLLKAKSLINNLQYQCITVARPQLEDISVLIAQQ